MAKRFRPPPVPVPSDKVIILNDPSHGFNYTRRKRLREDLKVILDDKRWQWVIIALVILDALLVCTDIILANAFCDEEHPPHKVEQAELALRAGSIAILSLFVLEWLLEAFAHGVRRWARSAIHLVDLVIVCVSLVLEVVATALHNRNLEIASLLVVFRLWRVVRVMHAVSDVQHHVKDEGKLSLQRRVQKLLSIQDAHHTVIKELHREYTERLLAVRRASALDGDDAAMAMADDWLDGGASDAKQAAAAPAGGAAAGAPPEATGGAAPTLEDVMSAVCRRSEHLRHAVALHLDSVHDRANELGRHDDAKTHALARTIVHQDLFNERRREREGRGEANGEVNGSNGEATAPPPRHTYHGGTTGRGNDSGGKP